jgi:hypothetical protein
MAPVLSVLSITIIGKDLISIVVVSQGGALRLGILP